MTQYIAAQNIASGFGTFHVGDELDEGVPEPVREAWIAAGLVEEAASEAASEPAKPAPVEKATKAPKETTAGRRMQTKATAGRRMQTKATPHKRFVEKAE